MGLGSRMERSGSNSLKVLTGDSRRLADSASPLLIFLTLLSAFMLGEEYTI
jgi:hypothetical protein